MFQTFRLTNEPDGLGLSCSSDGLSLAGVPLLRKTRWGFTPRSPAEIAALIEAAYGRDPTRLQSSLDAIADALNRGDLAHATLTAVLTRTPELDFGAATRLAHLNRRLSKYNPYVSDERRDWHGRWTDGAVGGAHRSASESVADNEARITYVSDSEERSSDWKGLARPAVSTSSDNQANDSETRLPIALEQEFERKYDYLGPIEFARQVIQFGDRLGREGKNLSPLERERARAEYSFIQDRLSFWLDYEYKPAIAEANLLSAALTVYQGAMNGGVVRVGDLPRSMVDVGNAAPNDNFPLRSRPSARPIEEPQLPSKYVPKEIEGTGRIASNKDVKLNWNGGLHDQEAWDVYIEKENPDAKKLRAYATTFDNFNRQTGEAISGKTLNTLAITYIKWPKKIYGKMTRYIEATRNYEPIKSYDVDPAEIKSRTLHLAVPEFTSPKQWLWISRGIIYGKDNGVRVVITRIKE